ncbi:unnamed protein product [Cunninghamella blakesleeana]
MNSSVHSPSSISTFVKQIKLFISSNNNKSSSTADTALITANNSNTNDHTNNNYESCLFHQEYVSFPSLDDHDEHNMNYQEPSRFMTENNKPVLC